MKKIFLIIFVLLLVGCSPSGDDEKDKLPDVVVLDCEQYYEQVDDKCVIVLSEQEQVMLEGLLELKLNLKDPSSLEVHRAFYYFRESYYGVIFDYSAKNSLGGMVRSTYEYFKADDEEDFILKETTFDYDFNRRYEEDNAVDLDIDKVMAKLNE